MRILTLFLCAAACGLSAEHRIDCAAGHTLADAGAIAMQPGDQLLFKAGCRWTGTLRPQGSGSEASPLVIGRYGEGAAPVIDGAGAESAVLLRNQEFVQIRDLEITNDAPEPGLRRGLLIRAENLGRALRHIHLRGLYVHHVKGRLGADMSSKATGGIGFEIVTTEKPTRLDDILVENCRVRTVDSVALYINTDSGPHPRDPQWEQLRHTRVVIRNNRFEDTGKNALIVRASLNPVIERNIVRNASARYHGNAIYVFGCKNAVLQFNEVSGTRFDRIEGAAFDSDYNSEGTVIQYNYSHDNGGGLVNLCNNPASRPPRGFNDGTVVRYNVSRNELHRVIAFDGPVTNTQIYNNTLHIGPGLKPNIVEFDVFGNSQGYADRTTFRNNLIVNEGEGTYVWGKATNFSFEANCFAGNHPESEPADPKKLTAMPRFENPAAGPEGYRLQPGSPCAASGVPVPVNGGRDYAGTGIASVPDRGAFQLPTYDVVDGLVWAKPHGFELKVDLYLPKGPGPFPAVVFLHGGGWQDRNRAQLRRQAAQLAALGIAGFAFEYRLSTQEPFPAALHDAKAAVRWVRANAAQYKIDPQRIAAAGSSAGGHLAALLGLTRGEAKYEGDGCCRDQSSSVVAVAALNPVLDLTGMDHRDKMITRFLGGPCRERLDLCRDASPVFHATPQAAPLLILHGTADETVPFRQAERMAGEMKSAGAPVELFTAPDGPHTFWSLPAWYPSSTDAMLQFLQRYLARR